MNEQNNLRKWAVWISLLFSWGEQQAFAQARMVLNGGIINISGGASLVLENPASNALVRNSGHIISEGQTNSLRWHIGSSTGTYSIPWGFGSNNYMPVSFSKEASAGPGLFIFSTYRTGWKNSAQLPGDVTNLNSGSVDNSAFVLDRFWQISARNYSAKPALSGLTFTYPDAEHTVPENTIMEDNLQAQRWNDVTGEWDDYAPAGSVNTTANTVRLSSVAAAELYDWWVLVDRSQPLPVELLNFNARADGKQVRLSWETAMELNNKSFIVERSRDGRYFEQVATIAGAGNSYEQRHYETLDKNPLNGDSYYRIKQVDFNGSWHFSPLKFVNLSWPVSTRLLVYPNPIFNGKFYIDLSDLQGQQVQLELHDLPGKKVLTKMLDVNQALIEITIGRAIRPGVYVVQIVGSGTLLKKKILIQ